MAPLRCVCTLLLALFCVLAAAGVRAESLRLPLTVDLELLRTLIVERDQALMDAQEAFDGD